MDYYYYYYYYYYYLFTGFSMEREQTVMLDHDGPKWKRIQVSRPFTPESTLN